MQTSLKEYTTDSDKLFLEEKPVLELVRRDSLRYFGIFILLRILVSEPATMDLIFIVLIAEAATLA
jgi:hypothetical protein